MNCGRDYQVTQRVVPGQWRRVVFFNDRFWRVEVRSSARIRDVKKWDSGMWRSIGFNESIDCFFPEDSTSLRIHLKLPGVGTYSIMVQPDKDIYLASEIREVPIPIS